MFRLIKALLRFIFVLIFVCGTVFVYARYVEPQMLATKDVSIKSSLIASEAIGLKIAVFGDTHFGDYYSTDDFEKVLDAIDKTNPDIVFFDGDLIDNFNTYKDDVGVISDMLSEIDAPLGKFAVFGNHDYGGGAENEYEGIMEAGGFTVLKNGYYALDDLGIGIIGIDDVVIGYGNSDIAAWARPDYFNIIISHAPDVIDDILDYNIDLMVSGHTHGRQINLSMFDEEILPPYGKKYVKGYYNFDNARSSQLYVNSGIGMTKLPYRFMSPPEVTCITLESK